MRLTGAFGVTTLAAVVAFSASVILNGESHAELVRTMIAAQSRIDAVNDMRIAQLRVVSTVRSAGLVSGYEVFALLREVDLYQALLARLKATEAAFAALVLDDEEKQ